MNYDVSWILMLLFISCCILGCLLFLICIEFVYLYFPVLFCLSVSVKWLAVKTASEMTYNIVSSGALNFTPTTPTISSIQYLKVKLTVSVRLLIPLFPLHLLNQLTFDNDVSARVGEWPLLAGDWNSRLYYVYWGFVSVDQNKFIYSHTL